jgi:hypothetical protein
MRRLLILILGLLIATPALAQAPTPVRIRGAIQSVDASSMLVKSREGATLKIALAENLGVSAVVPMALSAVDSGKFIGAAAMKQPDGTLRALEVLVFPETMRGAGEGHYPWDLQPESTMTNATVAAVVNGGSGRELTLTFKGESLKMVVPAEAPVVTFEAGDRSLLKPGAHFILTAQRAADGSLSAARVAVGKDGLVPPM